jgi:hypothetical protein
LFDCKAPDEAAADELVIPAALTFIEITCLRAPSQLEAHSLFIGR